VLTVTLTSMLNAFARDKKVLLVLDNVWAASQLAALLLTGGGRAAWSPLPARLCPRSQTPATPGGSQCTLPCRQSASGRHLDIVTG
jgi:hypothetical protein